MRLLALDSSALVASVAVLTEEGLLAEYTVNYKKTHSETLLPMIDEILRMLDLRPADLDAVALAGGPGSFTGLRIGASTAKGLGLALDIPLIPVPTVDALAYNLCGYTNTLVVPMMDARRSQVYTGIYAFRGEEMEPLLPQCAISLQELMGHLNRKQDPATQLPEETEAWPVVFLGDGVPAYRQQLEDGMTVPYRFAPAHLSRQRAASVGALALRYAAAGKTVPAGDFAPEYLRLSQAERERLERQKDTAGAEETLC